MTGVGPTGSGSPAPAHGGADVPPSPSPSPSPPSSPSSSPSSAEVRAARFTAANMLRSLLPLVVLVLLITGWLRFLHSGVDPVHPVDPSSTVQLAAARASYPMLVPSGLPPGYQPTSARTDAGRAKPGDRVTLQIGYATPGRQYAGFAVSDDPRAEAIASVLDGAQDQGAVQLGGASWTRSTTRRGETALSRQAGSATVVVTGSASEQELETVAGSVRPYSG